MKILAVASGGGHWTELLRLTAAFDGHELSFMCTNLTFRETVPNFPFYKIQDFSSWNKIKLIPIAFEIKKWL